VNVIAPKAIWDFVQRHPEAGEVLRDWYNTLRKSEFQNWSELKATFSSADIIPNEQSGLLVVFDIGGNKYRVVVKMDLQSNFAMIRHIFTHNEYTIWNLKGKPS
jgi:mRNA interferase HigB